MFIKIERKKRGTYLRIVESFRDEDGKPKHKTLHNIGRVEDYSKQSLLSLGNAFIKLAGGTTLGTDSPLVEELARYNYGFEWIIKHLMKEYGLTELFERIALEKGLHMDLVKPIFLMILERLRNPGSKRSNHLNQDHYLSLSRNDIPLQHLYRSLDHLADKSESIKACIRRANTRNLKTKLDFVFYDVTTFYFDSDKEHQGSLRQKGFSKDGKIGKTQVVFGLLIDKNKQPLDYFIYEGNKYEGHTFTDVIDALKKKHGLKKVVIVSDRGMMSRTNIAHLEEISSYNYIIGERLKNLPKKISKELINLSNYKNYITVKDGSGEEQVIRYYTLKYKNKMLIGTYSKKRARKDQHGRTEKVKKGEALLKNPSEVMNKASRLFLKNNGDNHFELDQEKIEKSSEYDGFVCISTNLKNVDVGEVLSRYKDLYQIEHSFRSFKSYLETRPIFHWNDQRIRGHLCLCYMSYALITGLKNRLKKKASFHE